MSRGFQVGLTVVGGLFGSVCMIAAIACMFSGPGQPTVGASGEVTGTVIPWSTVIAAVMTLLGSSSFLAPYLAFFKRFVPTSDPVAPAPAPVQPVIVRPVNPDVQSVTAEAIEAAIGFFKDMKNVDAERRFVTAVMTTLAQLPVFKSPAVAAALAVLTQEIVKVWFPASSEGAAK